jgi:hypothetical protein
MESADGEFGSQANMGWLNRERSVLTSERRDFYSIGSVHVSQVEKMDNVMRKTFSVTKY